MNHNKINNNEEVILPYEENEKEYFIEDLGKINKKFFYSIIKRIFDFILSLVAIIILIIPMVFIGLLVKLTSKGPILYKQERLGKNGKPFKLVKFRSMKVDAEANGAQWSKGDADPRITKFGRFLRKTRIDELPQLFTILNGKMSIVGPRPERAVFYDEFEKYIHGFNQRMKVKPGLTGLAQVNGGYDLKPEEKIIYDIKYIKNRSLWLDFKIIIKTVLVIFTHKGAK